MEVILNVLSCLEHHTSLGQTCRLFALICTPDALELTIFLWGRSLERSQKASQLHRLALRVHRINFHTDRDEFAEVDESEILATEQVLQTVENLLVMFPHLKKIQLSGSSTYGPECMSSLRDSIAVARLCFMAVLRYNLGIRELAFELSDWRDFPLQTGIIVPCYASLRSLRIDLTKSWDASDTPYSEEHRSQGLALLLRSTPQLSYLCLSLRDSDVSESWDAVRVRTLVDARAMSWPSFSSVSILFYYFL